MWCLSRTLVLQLKQNSHKSYLRIIDYWAEVCAVVEYLRLRISLDRSSVYDGISAYVALIISRCGRHSLYCSFSVWPIFNNPRYFVAAVKKQVCPAPGLSDHGWRPNCRKLRWLLWSRHSRSSVDLRVLIECVVEARGRKNELLEQRGITVDHISGTSEGVPYQWKRCVGQREPSAGDQIRSLHTALES